MNAIITVVGTDQVGIIAKVSACLSKHEINIIDITQTILSGNFVMMMMVDLSRSDLSIQDTKKELSSLGDELGVSINMMHERVFSAMHRI
jgi:ACT domain-containing protein